jgi:hypothetical protein
MLCNIRKERKKKNCGELHGGTKGKGKKKKKYFFFFLLPSRASRWKTHIPEAPGEMLVWQGFAFFFFFFFFFFFSSRKKREKERKEENLLPTVQHNPPGLKRSAGMKRKEGG